MIHIATGLIFDRDNKLLIYLRDNKPTIPFPNYWDLFGGYVEQGEKPEQALRREVKEELGVELKECFKFKDVECLAGDVHQNIKHIFWAKIDATPENLKLRVGQKLASIDLSQRHNFKFANILGNIIDDFTQSGIILN